MSALHVEHLVRVRKIIAERQITFICRALFHGCGYGAPEEVYDIKHEIDRALQGRSTLEGWLENYGINAFSANIDMVEYRLAWIDLMIEYWRDK